MVLLHLSEYYQGNVCLLTFPKEFMIRLQNRGMFSCLPTAYELGWANEDSITSKDHEGGHVYSIAHNFGGSISIGKMTSSHIRP